VFSYPTRLRFMHQDDDMS